MASAKVRNVSGEDLHVPWLGRMVLAGQIVEVPADDVYAYTSQAATWAPSGKEAQALHEKAEKAAQKAVGGEPDEAEPDNNETPEG